MSKGEKSLTRRDFCAATGAITLSSLTSGNAAAIDSNEALELAESRRQELVDLLSQMVSIRSLSGESAAVAQGVVKEYLSQLPYRIEESTDRPSRYVDHPEYMPPNPPGDGPFVNVIGWPENAASRQFAMFSHIDTHSMDDGWNTEPFTPVIQDNRMYGLGTSDDKGGVAAMLVAATALAEKGETLPVVMSLHGKGGGSRGSLPVFDRLSGTQHGIGAVLYVHPAETGRGLDDIKNAVLGVCDFELSVNGWRGPLMEIGSIDSPEWGEGGNALDMCWQVLERLRRSAFSDVQFNLGVMDGGDRVGSVADQASARFRLKFDGESTWTGLLESAREAIAELRGEPGFDDERYEIMINPVGYRTNPGAADWDAPVSRVLRDSIESVKGRAPSSYPNHYAGDIRYPIRLLGVPAYGIGSLGGNFYGPNEWVDIDDLVNLVAVLIRTMSGWQEL